MASRLLVCSERCPPAMQQRDQWHIKDFALVKEIGSGAVSCVYYALCRKSCLRVAIKVYNKTKLTKLNIRQVEREIMIHSNLSHPHIVDFYAAFEDEQGIYMVLEYAEGGDLFDAVKRSGGRMPESALVQQVLYPYLCSLMYLHAKGIIHRDIKPENTVFTRELVLKITDFGLAINKQEERPVTRLGTLDYMAPEVLQCPDKYVPSDNKDRADLMYNEAVDAWAMGVLAYELIVGRPPFGMADREGTMRAIMQMQPFMPDWVSSGAASFILMALDKAPATRAPIARLIQHPWITMHTRAKDSLFQQQASALQHTMHRLHRPMRGLSTTSSSTTRLPPGSMDLPGGSPLGAAAAALAAHPKASSLAFLDGGGGGFGSAGSSMTGSGWQPPVVMMQAAGPAGRPAAGAQAGPGLQLQSSHQDPRPAKRLLQQRTASHMSDAGGGAQARGIGAKAQAQVQAYWCNLGPGWGGAGAGGEQGAAPEGSGIDAHHSPSPTPTPSPLEHLADESGRTIKRSSSKRRIQDVDVDPGPDITSNSMMQLLLDEGAAGAGGEAQQGSQPTSPQEAGAGATPPAQPQQQGQRTYLRSSSMHTPSPSPSPLGGHGPGGHQHPGPSRFARAQRPASAAQVTQSGTSGGSDGAAAPPAPADLAAAGSADWGSSFGSLGLTGLNLRSHPLSSPFVTPCSSPMHAGNGRPFDPFQPVEPGKGPDPGPAGQLELAGLSGIMEVAGLSISSPGPATPAGQAGDKRNNGSSSGDSTGGPISPAVLQFMAGQSPESLIPSYAALLSNLQQQQQQQQQQAVCDLSLVPAAAGLGLGAAPTRHLNSAPVDLRQQQQQQQQQQGGFPYHHLGAGMEQPPSVFNPGAAPAAMQQAGGQGLQMFAAGQQQAAAAAAAAASLSTLMQQLPDSNGLQLLREPFARSLSGTGMARRGGSPRQPAAPALAYGQQPAACSNPLPFLDRSNSATSTLLSAGHNPFASSAGTAGSYNMLEQQAGSVNPYSTQAGSVNPYSDSTRQQQGGDVAQRGGHEPSPINVDLLLPFMDMDDGQLSPGLGLSEDLVSRFMHQDMAAQDEHFLQQSALAGGKGGLHSSDDLLSMEQLDSNNSGQDGALEIDVDAFLSTVVS